MTDPVSLTPPSPLRRAALVGRAEELGRLEKALGLVREKQASHTVTIVGAGGIGKTRLMRDFLQKLRGQRDKSPRVFRGSAREGDGSYGIFSRILRARFGLVEGMDTETSKAQVRAQVAATLEDRKVGDVVYFLGQILDLAFDDSPIVQAIEGDADELKPMRRAIIRRFLEADAGVGVTVSPEAPPRSPVVLVFDNLQHADEESLDLLAYLIRNLGAPVLILCLGRPELLARRERWFDVAPGRHAEIQLAPLSDVDAATVMQDLLAPCVDDPAAEELIESACTLAGGNPGLLEQMEQIFLDMGVIKITGEADSEKWTVHAEQLSAVRLPMTVEEAVAARIAALSPKERDILERASVMGGVFWLGGLVAISRLDEDTPDIWKAEEARDTIDVRNILKDLNERDYVLRLPDSTFPGDEEFAFKHNLERETLFKLVSAGVRRKYHGCLADWLSYKDHVRTHEEYVAMLARHREQAGSLAQATVGFLEAANVARSHYANSAAVSYYEQGLRLVEEGGVGLDPEKHIRALHHYGDVLQSLGRNDEAVTVFRRMLTRAYRIDQKTKGGAAHGRLGRLFRETGRLEEAEKHLEAALQLFEIAGDERGIASTTDDLGKLHWMRGNYKAALEATQRALAMRRKLGDRRSIALSLNNLGLVCQDSGEFKKALEAFEQALQIRREIGDLVGVSISLNNLGTVAQDQRDDAHALKLFHEALELARETGDRTRIALILTNLGETMTRLGTLDLAIQHLREAEQIAEELGDKLGHAETLRGLGKAYLARGDGARALEATARAVELFREVDSRVQTGIALRALGEVTAAGTASPEGLGRARKHLAEAVSIFEAIGNDIELARSCRSYAEVLRAAAESNPSLLHDASTMAERADAIFARLRASAEHIDSV